MKLARRKEFNKNNTHSHAYWPSPEVKGISDRHSRVKSFTLPVGPYCHSEYINTVILKIMPSGITAFVEIAVFR
jgi:hypothetical protein